jgi:hypothetical protein
VAWVETPSLSFTARHEAAQGEDALQVLQALEAHRAKLEDLFPRIPGNVTVILHDSSLQLGLAQPYLLLRRRLSSPAARRYMAGWYSSGEVHTLSPEVLRRQSAGPDSLDALLLTPLRAYTQLVVGTNNASLPPPFRPAHATRLLRHAWLAEGAAQYFSGQVPFLRPAIATGLRAGTPACPPRARDAGILAGALFDLLARERGPQACVRLARQTLGEGSQQALEEAFEQPRAEIAQRFRAHLERLAAPAAGVSAPSLED